MAAAGAAQAEPDYLHSKEAFYRCAAADTASLPPAARHRHRRRRRQPTCPPQHGQGPAGGAVGRPHRREAGHCGHVPDGGECRPPGRSAAHAAACTRNHTARATSACSHRWRSGRRTWTSARRRSRRVWTSGLAGRGRWWWARRLRLRSRTRWMLAVGGGGGGGCTMWRCGCCSPGLHCSQRTSRMYPSPPAAGQALHAPVRGRHHGGAGVELLRACPAQGSAATGGSIPD